MLLDNTPCARLLHNLSNLSVFVPIRTDVGVRASRHYRTLVLLSAGGLPLDNPKCPKIAGQKFVYSSWIPRHHRHYRNLSPKWFFFNSVLNQIFWNFHIFCKLITNLQKTSTARQKLDAIIPPEENLVFWHARVRPHSFSVYTLSLESHAAYILASYTRGQELDMVSEFLYESIYPHVSDIQIR